MYKNQNFSITKGNNKEIVFEVVDEDDLIGSSIKWVLGKDKLKQKSDNIEINGNKFIVKITPEDTEELNEGTYPHEAQLIDVDGNIYTVSTGEVYIYEKLI